ncbi:MULTISPECIES: hypothetical protein [unclassified Microcoleus]|uniref:hypothetical protein n=1 Tax=unclassified Microcoleus TaxID=2642155 RepID=UPI002FD3D08F
MADFNTLLRTGKMPVPQQSLLIVEQAGKPVPAVKRQVVALADFNTLLRTGKMPVPQQSLLIVEQAGKPVPDRSTKYQ